MRAETAKLKDRSPMAAQPWLRRALWSGFLIGVGVLSLSVATRSAEARQHADASAGATGAIERSEAPFTPQRRAQRIETMREGGGVRPPAGYERFCAADRTYCRAPALRDPGAVVTVDDQLMAQLDAFNRGINAAYTPGEDMQLYGVADHWTLPSTHADCEDYVLAKQSALIAAGWPPEAVLIGVVVGELSPFHAVLILRTSRGELVLDNMRDEILDWRDTGYTWVIRQSTQRPERWVTIRQEDGQGPNIVVANGAVGAS